MNTKTRLSVKRLLPASIPFLVSLLLLVWWSPSPMEGSELPMAKAAGIGTVPETAPPFPTTPPDVSKISVGAPDVDGDTIITGAPGAVPGDMSLAIINLSTRNVITTTANSNGAFSANLFAPSGSSILVKYSQDPSRIDQLWFDALNPGGDFIYMNPLPGATFFVSGAPSGSGVPFHSAGFFGPIEGPGWAGWWMSGQVTRPVASR